MILRIAVGRFCGGVVIPGSLCPQAFIFPLCDAKPGIPCRHPSGHTDMHPERWQRAEDRDVPPAGIGPEISGLDRRCN